MCKEKEPLVISELCQNDDILGRAAISPIAMALSVSVYVCMGVSVCYNKKLARIKNTKKNDVCRC